MVFRAWAKIGLVDKIVVAAINESIVKRGLMIMCAILILVKSIRRSNRFRISSVDMGNLLYDVVSERYIIAVVGTKSAQFTAGPGYVFSG